MKWLFISLLVVNLGLFGWQYDRRIADSLREVADSKPALTGAPPLQLLSELAALPPQKSDTAQTALAPVAEIRDHIEAADHCLDIGPFDEAAARDRLRDWLRDFVARLQTRTETVRKRRFFWVYLEPSSEESARRSLDDLRQRGVTDYMLIRRGEMKNAISLGLFRSQDSVNRRLAEMSEQGYQPVVVPRFETSEQYWVTAQIAAEFDDDLELPETLLAGASAQAIACDELAGLDAETSP